MTEKSMPLSTPLSTQFVPPSQTAVASLSSPHSLQPSILNNKAEAVEEEPYTIKCICGFSDDDGNTIYCETCDSWQHIECFYPNNVQEAYREDFAHSCADCKFRPLDRRRAYEHQSLRLRNVNATETPDRSKKRPPSKNHKKKKPAEFLTNGQTNQDLAARPPTENGTAQGHRKSKSTHRLSQSVGSKDHKRSPSFSQKSGNPHGHPPSPATTPPDNYAQDFEIHNYSTGFHDLYKEESDFPIVQTNSFVSLVISNILSLWLRDHDKLKDETGCDYSDVFNPSSPNVDSEQKPPVVEHKDVVQETGLPLHWQYLRTSDGVDKDVPLIELNGQIGIQKNYCEDPENRWAELSSPLPFVFFHPMLPIYIDTRKEGSQARYVRRSCQPNAIVDTFLSGGSEYHFWLVSDRAIGPDEEITIPWDFRLPKRARMLQLLGLGDDATRPQPEFDMNDLDSYHQTASWIHTVLSEYGGCACELGPECAFARFHRTYISRTQSKTAIKKKSRKPKNGLSPTEASHASDSRAASEGHGEDGADNDSGSSRSKPPSRDLTPARQGSFDTLGVLTEMTDREKRKVQMAEDTFRRMEQQQPPRKKKRISDGSGGSAPPKMKTPKLMQGTSTGTNGAFERRYVDAGTSRRISGSPAISPGASDPRKYSVAPSDEDAKVSRTASTGQPPQYRDCGVQTDPVEGEWFSPVPLTPKPKKRVISLSKRLLQNRYRYKADDNSCHRSDTASPSLVASALIKMDLDSPTAEPTSPVLTQDSLKTASTPTPVTDAMIIDKPDADAMASVNTVEEPPPTESDVGVVTAVKVQSPEIRVQVPPVPAFDNAEAGAVANIVSQSATTPVVQSPSINVSMANPFAPSVVNGIAAHPSPVKKKLSLSDYTKSRQNKISATKPSMTSLKVSASILEDASPPTTDVVMVDPMPEDKSPS
ncbi:[histone H3]-lysine4 N-trimethyltransferase MLL5 [Microdochium nivale]|nr:[histone H3]-lysine4 N-trimethyltransferase MLL5 [Microdochium nivale]